MLGLSLLAWEAFPCQPCARYHTASVAEGQFLCETVPVPSGFPRTPPRTVQEEPQAEHPPAEGAPMASSGLRVGKPGLGLEKQPGAE